VTSWQDLDAAIQDEGGVVPCQNAPDMFFQVDDRDRKTYAIPRQLCAACPVRELCLSYALDSRELFGMWGGLAPRERLDLLRGGRVA
jgi:WhiB family redox-sensing transcriptional regulator